MYTYVARQPIFNKSKQTIGYELLFRDGEHNAFPTSVGENRATYRLVSESFLSVGRNPAFQTSRCFINFPYDSIIQGLPKTLPKEQVVIEILETCEPTKELLEAVRDLNRAGYVVALDDFNHDYKWDEFLPYVHILKLDIMRMGIDDACDYVIEQRERGVNVSFLAERVETQDEFDAAKEAGFRFFQGFFFSKPEMLKQKYVSPDQVLALELIKEVIKPEVNYTKVESILEKDVSLSYKLLRFVNSASPRIDEPITSFKQALVYLGQDKLKIFVSLAVASFISAEKPLELYSLSMQRAQFCQLMSRHDKFREHRQNAFIIGLFSMLDALLDSTLDELVADLPLPESAKEALIWRAGAYGSLLKMQECYERADWLGLESECKALGLELTDVSTELSQAQKWSQDMAMLTSS
ncbi:HDOD domain-containing protein [Vibrio sp. JC009]|uniref:EAL and HDOD domain-containing protein n=1 Tax=Vibrio sp. JC009 TaxID=2912314 RepID=UPI0023AEFCAE|nr:HDOD domain-containing protein [Vibrio sp. JC009]WED21761.1 HDOD domain-containing protein [Vibrio sp. JC009]